MSVSESDHDDDRSSKGGDDETVQFDAVQELLELNSATILPDTEAVQQACALWSRPEVVEAIVTGPQSTVLGANAIFEDWSNPRRVPQRQLQQQEQEQEYITGQAFTQSLQPSWRSFHCKYE